MSDKQARVIYQYRWGIEVFSRTFKQTFGRHKLRSHNAENAKMELDWSLLALWMICLLGQRELVQSVEDPSQLSPALAIHLQRLKKEPQLSGKKKKKQIETAKEVKKTNPNFHFTA